jgi:hypothetical protein
MGDRGYGVLGVVVDRVVSCSSGVDPLAEYWRRDEPEIHRSDSDVACIRSLDRNVDHY